MLSCLECFLTYSQIILCIPAFPLQIKLPLLHISLYSRNHRIFSALWIFYPETPTPTSHPQRKRDATSTVFATGQSVRSGPGRGRTVFCRSVRSFSKVARQVRMKDEDGWHYVVPSGHFPNLPCNSPSRTRAPASPGRNVSHWPSCRPPPSAVPQLPDVQSHRGSLTFFLIIFAFFRFTHLYYLLPYCFLCFGVFPCPSLFSLLTHFRLMGSGVEMQLNLVPIMDAGVIESQ